MFATTAQAVGQARGREARACRLRELFGVIARATHEVSQIVREADDARDWDAAGCSSSAAWVAQLSASDYRTAARIARTSDALRALPALDRALEAGELSLDQVAAAARHATPETDRELARIAIGKAPSEVGVAARKMAPPKAADDEALYRRRALGMRWTRGRRELVIQGRLPLEAGVVFEQTIRDIAKAQRAEDTRDGVEQEWQQSCADALISLAQTGGGGGGAGRTRTTLVVHVGDSAPPVLEGAGPISPETAERLACNARRLTIRREGDDLVHSRVTRCASYAQLRALHRRSEHCQYPGCSARRELHAHHLVADTLGGKTRLDNLIHLCSRHHTRIHDHRIRTGGTGDAPVFSDKEGRLITVAQPHAPPG